MKLLLIPLCIMLLPACQPKGRSPASDLTTAKTETQNDSPITPVKESPLTGTVFPEGGKIIDPDSVRQPRMVPLTGPPKIVPIPNNVIPAGQAKEIHLPDQLTEITPGENGVPPPEMHPAQIRKVPPHYSNPVPAGVPKMMDQASSNIHFLRRNEGLPGTYIRNLLVDSQGNLWIGGAGGGVTRYDGTSFTYFRKGPVFGDGNITSMLEDRQGHLWIGSRDGLYRYDGQNFWHYTTINDSGGPWIWSILQDHRGNLWIGTEKEGVIRYAPDAYDGQGAFIQYTTEQGLSDDRVRVIAEDSRGDLWFGTDRGVSRFRPGALSGSFTRFAGKEGLTDNQVTSILEDSRGNLWLGTGEEGVIRYAPDAYQGRGSFTHFTGRQGLSNDRVRAIAEDGRGNLWFGTAGGGVNRYDGKNFTWYRTKEGLSNDIAQSIVADSQGKVWIGTEDGVNYYNDRVPVTYFNQGEALAGQQITSILEDHGGQIWIGTELQGVICYDPPDPAGRGEMMRQYTIAEGLRSNTVRPLLEDTHGNLWFGGSGVTRFDPRAYGGRGGITFYTSEEGLSSNSISSMLEDEQGQIWFGTSGGGINRYNGTQFTQYIEKENFHPNQLRSAYRGQNGTLWFGASRTGLFRYNGRAFFYYNTADTIGIINAILEDSRHNLWLAVSDPEIIRFSVSDSTFYRFSLQGGSRSILEDSYGNIWTNGHFGLEVMKISSDKISSTESHYEHYSFGETEGIRTAAGGWNNMCIDRSNRLWWPTGNGVGRLDLNQLKLPTDPPRVKMDYLMINETAVDFRRIADSTYRQSIDIGPALRGSFDSVAAFYNYPLHLRLPHQLNHLTLHFSAIDWSSLRNLKYSYLMEGLDKKWSLLSPENKADYRNIPPGSYIFKVKAIGSAGIWSDVFEYPFRVLPPWWTTWWAYGLYAGLILLALYGLRHYEFRRYAALSEARRLKELDAFKTRLYTNITHEFRTPLTIILGMVRQVREDPKKWYSEGLQMIHRNGRQLLVLVNQILDLNKLDNRKLQLRPQRGELVAYLTYLVQSFESHAAAKNIQLHFLKEEPQLEMDFDPDQLSKVINNLLANAIKFTPEEGHIYVSLRQTGLSPSGSSPEMIEISVKDTGRGIPEKDLPYIFDRFYQVDRIDADPVGGTGIGLSLVRELVDLMEGDIQVQSEPDEGTTFRVHLPVRRAAGTEPHPTEIPETLREEIPPLASLPSHLDSGGQGLPPSSSATVLLIEDNKDVMRYLTSCLESQYHLEYANNGREGVEVAIELMPDLIISDVMMPEMNGYEVTATLKNDERTSHIPILLLTAKAGRDARIEGFAKGADAYLSKPFDPKELEIRLSNLIQLRQKLQSRYASLAAPAGSGDPMFKAEDTFISNFRKIIEDHIEDETYGILQITRAMQISRTQLHNKLKALTGRSTSQVIRSIRLQRAKELLLHSGMNVSEVAYAVGFKNTTYFSSCFSKEFGLPPSELKNQGDPG